MMIENKGRSWLDSEKTDRIYHVDFVEFPIWRVFNQYQKIECPHCNEVIYCRLTQIWHYDSDSNLRNGDPEIHTNYKDSLEPLKELLITYNRDKGIEEKCIDEKWKLVLDSNEVVGAEINV